MIKLYVQAPPGSRYASSSGMAHIQGLLDEHSNLRAQFTLSPDRARLPMPEPDGTWKVSIYNRKPLALVLVKGILTDHYGLDIIKEAVGDANQEYFIAPFGVYKATRGELSEDDYYRLLAHTSTESEREMASQALRVIPLLKNPTLGDIDVAAKLIGVLGDRMPKDFGSTVNPHPLWLTTETLLLQGRD